MIRPTPPVKRSTTASARMSSGSTRSRSAIPTQTPPTHPRVRSRRTPRPPRLSQNEVFDVAYAVVPGPPGPASDGLPAPAGGRVDVGADIGDA